MSIGMSLAYVDAEREIESQPDDDNRSKAATDLGNA